MQEKREYGSERKSNEKEKESEKKYVENWTAEKKRDLVPGCRLNRRAIDEPDLRTKSAEQILLNDDDAPWNNRNDFVDAVSEQRLNQATKRK